MPDDAGPTADAALGSSPFDQVLGGNLSAINSIVGIAANWFQVLPVLFSAFADLLSSAQQAEGSVDQLIQTDRNILNVVAGSTEDLNLEKLHDLKVRAMDDVNHLLVGGLSDPAVNPSQYIQDVDDGVHLFFPDNTGSDPYWIRPYRPDLTFYDPWFDHDGSPPTTGNGSTQVFDPRIPLAAFPAAISLFTPIYTIFYRDHNYAETVPPNYADLATVLDNHFQIAVGGLKAVPIPSFDDFSSLTQLFSGGHIGVQDGSGQSMVIPPSWEASVWHGEVGAVDTYAMFGPSAYESAFGFHGVTLNGNDWPTYTTTTNPGNIIDVYPALNSLFTIASSGDQEDPFQAEETRRNMYRWFRVRMQVGNMIRFKALYLAKGYDRIWKLIQTLRYLSAGKAGTPLWGYPATPPPEATDWNAHWSLSDFDAVINGWDYDQKFGGGYSCAKFYCAYSPPDDTPPYCRLTGASPQITVENIITRLRAVLDNSINYPTDYPPYPAYGKPLSRPLSLRKAIVGVSF